MGLRVCDEPAQRVGYDRTDFGRGHEDEEPRIIEGLPQMDGQVYTPYTCTLFDIESNGTAATDIEHIVALAEAWDSGIPSDMRRTFGGDIENLTVAVPSVNRNEKADNDAGEWVPERNRGWYAATIVKVKQKYSLSVDSAERDALERALREDPSREVTCGTSVPALPFLKWLIP